MLSITGMMTGSIKNSFRLQVKPRLYLIRANVRNLDWTSSNDKIFILPSGLLKRLEDLALLADDDLDIPKGHLRGS